MNVKEIRELAQIMKESGLTALEITEGDSIIRMENKQEPAPIVAAPPVPSVTTIPISMLDETAPIVPSAPPAAETTATVPSTVKPSGKEVKSPMVGVYYAAPSPDAQPFVSVGSRVKKGDVLCIIEAMKLMNEITADCDGEIAECYLENGQIVEFGQVLFRIL